MSPDKALELVGRYARLTKLIKVKKAEIGEHLEKCKGIKGDRLNVDEHGWPTYQPEMDVKNRDKGLHLWSWYQPEVVDDGYMSQGLEWLQIGVLEAEECPHCYAAHLAIQERKQTRKELAAVKGAMSRSTT